MHFSTRGLFWLWKPKVAVFLLKVKTFFMQFANILKIQDLIFPTSLD